MGGVPRGRNLTICLILDHFRESQLKGDPNLRGHPEKFNIGFFSQNFFGSPNICWEVRKKILEPKVNVKFFTVDPYTPCYRVSCPFPIWSIWQIWPLLGQKNMFFGGLVNWGNQIWIVFG